VGESVGRGDCFTDVTGRAVVGGGADGRVGGWWARASGEAKTVEKLARGEQLAGSDRGGSGLCYEYYTNLPPPLPSLCGRPPPSPSASCYLPIQPTAAAVFFVFPLRPQALHPLPKDPFQKVEGNPNSALPQLLLPSLSLRFPPVSPFQECRSATSGSSI
jgi:hypothetical protein